MLTKRQMCINLLRKNNILICPYCMNKLILNDEKLLCENKHSFDISKKGNFFLINTTKYKSSKIYDKNLFENRRRFIDNNYYSVVYEYISDRINSLNLNNVKILDIGCGEGLHSRKIQNKINCNSIIYGLDYSKDAINMATDYLKYGNLYFVADISNIPLIDNSIDVIIDYLSPFNALEINRVLKDDGIIIKIAPGNNYLKELRNFLNMENYEKKEEVKSNILKNFDLISEYEIDAKFKIDGSILKNLINMMPINNKNINVDKQFEEITVNVIMYVLRKR